RRFPPCAWHSYGEVCEGLHVFRTLTRRSLSAMLAGESAGFHPGGQTKTVILDHPEVPDGTGPYSRESHLARPVPGGQASLYRPFPGPAHGPVPASGLPV